MVFASLFNSYSNFITNAETRTQRAVDIVSAEVDNSLDHAADVLQHLSRSIEIYGPGLVSDDLDPRMSVASSDRSYLGLSVWSPFGDLLVTTDPNHTEFDLDPILEILTTAIDQNAAIIPQKITVQSSTEGIDTKRHRILLARGLFESEEFVGFSVIEVSLAHLTNQLNRIQTETGVPFRLAFDRSPLTGLPFVHGVDQLENPPDDVAVFSRQLPYGFSVDAFYRSGDVQSAAIWSMAWLIVLATLFGAASRRFFSPSLSTGNSAAECNARSQRQIRKRTTRQRRSRGSFGGNSTARL